MKCEFLTVFPSKMIGNLQVLVGTSNGLVSRRESKGDFCLRMRGKVKNFFYFATFVNALRERAVFGSAEFNNRTFERESFFNKSSVSHLKHVTAKSNSK